MFADRADAGRLLGQRLREELGEAPDALVLALPRGGVPVAAEVASAIGAELDVLVVRKIGAPSNPEVAIGAIGPGGVTVESELAGRFAPEKVARVRERELAELDRRERRYRAGRPSLELTGRRVIVVDDGVATGATALAAVHAVRALGAREVIVAAPVAAPDARAALARDADAVVVLAAPADFHAVGQFYRDFAQTTDAEVLRVLAPPGG